MGRLDSKVVVTGGESGIGLTAARLFVAEGACSPGRSGADVRAH